jgi:hypothetical protein
MVSTIFKTGMGNNNFDAYFIAKRKTISICVLSSMNLQAIVKIEDIMERTLIVSRLSENKGINSLVRFTLKHSELVCMREGLLSL